MYVVNIDTYCVDKYDTNTALAQHNIRKTFSDSIII